MGSIIEINDTLKISKDRGRGFPIGLKREEHMTNPESSNVFLGQEFDFWNDDERLYHRPPTRVFFVEEMPDGKWLYWGNALVSRQTIEDGKTLGRYKITKIYKPDFQRDITNTESPPGKSFYEGEPKAKVLTE
jgi:hypothetical protein